MFKVKIITIGKTKETWLSEGILEYEKRLKPFMSLEWKIAKNDEGLLSFLDLEKRFIAFDLGGLPFSSSDFSTKLHQELEKGGSRLSFVIGGAEGLPPAIKKRAHKLWSLSPLTFTHQLARLILLEQLYRAVEIERGSAYHK
jgi:23S rRNA (pseudouridine1915-N3)-methyltransferase